MVDMGVKMAVLIVRFMVSPFLFRSNVYQSASPASTRRSGNPSLYSRLAEN
jgi:hypothetical protein